MNEESKKDDARMGPCLKCGKTAPMFAMMVAPGRLEQWCEPCIRARQAEMALAP